MITFKVDDLKKMNEMIRSFSEYLRESGVSDEDIFSSKIVSCELISNAIIHGGEAAVFEGELEGGDILITVSAAGFDGVNLSPKLPDAFAESGRGMYIVNTICLGNVQKCGEGLKVVIKRKK